MTNFKDQCSVSRQSVVRTSVFMVRILLRIQMLISSRIWISYFYFFIFLFCAQQSARLITEWANLPRQQSTWKFYVSIERRNYSFNELGKWLSFSLYYYYYYLRRLLTSSTDPPEIEIERSWIHTGVHQEAYLTCIVHAEPGANVISIRLIK
jgi:hypothetical protein